MSEENRDNLQETAVSKEQKNEMLVVESAHYDYMVNQIKNAAARIAEGNLSPDNAVFLFSFLVNELAKVRCMDPQHQNKIINEAIVFIQNLGLPLQAKRMEELYK